MSTPKPTLQEMLSRFYKEERNLELSSFWDGGWMVKMGDSISGFTTTAVFDTLDDVIYYLERYYKDHVEKPKNVPNPK